MELETAYVEQEAEMMELEVVVQQDDHEQQFLDHLKDSSSCT